MKRYQLLAWGGFVLTAIVSAGAIFLVFVPLPGQPLALDASLNEVTGVLINPLLALVGAVVAANRRQNPNGWLLIGIGLVAAASSFLTNYVQAAFWSGTETLPGGLLAAWLAQWSWLNIFLGLILLFHLFPAGTFLSRRWRWVAGGSVLVFLGLMTLDAFRSPIPVTTSQGTLNLANPIGLFETSHQNTPPLFVAMFSVPILAALSSLLLRFIRARGIECEQMIWVLYAASLLIITTILGFFTNNFVFQIFSNLIVMGLPLAIGAAILRYRLYDIDILIRRTLIYSILTALLALVYFGSVLLLEQLFRAFTGAQQSEIVTIISTLAIATLFNPLRHRVQNIIDRRFFRRKYDAQKVLAQFAQTARDETDLQQLTTRLIEVVHETIQPAHVSLWLKDALRNATPSGPPLRGHGQTQRRKDA